MEESGQTSVRIKPEGCVHHKISKKKKKKGKKKEKKKERKKERKKEKKEKKETVKKKKRLKMSHCTACQRKKVPPPQKKIAIV